MWAFVDRSGGPLACWPWTGKLVSSGYGRINWGDGSIAPHRLALELKLGRQLAAGEVTRHGAECRGNRACCNPAHLEPGSAQDNADDMVRDGTRLRGESAPAAKLTKAQALEIIRLAADMGRGKYELLARRFGVSGKQIANICAGKRWPHLARTVAP